MIRVFQLMLMGFFIALVVGCGDDKKSTGKKAVPDDAPKKAESPTPPDLPDGLPGKK